MFKNEVFVSTITSVCMAQFLKALIVLLVNKKASFKEVMITMLWNTGGMPSSHSAMVVSLCTSIGFKDGISSDIFILSLFFALVVIRDALGVRRATGVQARSLNTLGAKLNEKLNIGFKAVKEVHGHTLPQVIAGGLLGFFIAVAVSVL